MLKKKYLRKLEISDICNQQTYSSEEQTEKIRSLTIMLQTISGENEKLLRIISQEEEKVKNRDE